MENLGNMLRETIDRKAREEDSKRRAKEEAARLKREQDEKVAKEFCESVKASISLAIRSGEVPKGKKIPSSAPFDTYRWTVELDEPFKENPIITPIFNELISWGQNNGLKIHFPYCHDGMGIDSWHEVRVSPL